VIRRCGFKTFTPGPQMKRGSVTSRRKSTLGAHRRLISSGVEEFQAARGGGSWAPAGARLHGLASPDLAHPLVTMSGDPYDMRKCEVVLTDAGESVLAAQANAVELNGIDDWILGVHIDSKRGSVWYQREGTLVTR
jgi:hypothetical protein